mgnify:CR=1 FL=1
MQNQTHKAKKSLGQNFLKSESALNKIVDAGEVSKEDTVIEIGPGKGALTAKLLEKAGQVIAIEKDLDLVEFLKEKFEKEIASGALILQNEDILNFTPKSPYKIIANIPYNITGAILKKFLTDANQPERMVLMVQHEVAKRIVARDNKESILSISVKAYGVPKIVTKVEARYFSPQPKVDSAVISITGISRKTFQENNINEENFWKIVHAGFAHKRKKLSGNLKNIISAEKLKEMKIGDKRAEDLPISDWLLLSKVLQLKDN